LPSGLRLKYSDLKWKAGLSGLEFTYRTRNGRTKIYGGKVIENVCQALARCVIAEQMLAISKRFKVALTVHDSIVISCLDEQVEEAELYVMNCMRNAPVWAEGLPLDCEAFSGKSYGECGE
jgi:DNA polymerase